MSKLTYAARAAAAIAADPYEGVERVLENVATWRDERRGVRYRPTPDWDARLHALLGAPPECGELEAFGAVWEDAVHDLRARGLPVGRGAFGGWDDGDLRLARLAWCVTRHLRPAHVVETGVARGLTTRVLLEALERNRRGRLWSIDLPPILESSLEAQTGAAVPERLKERWTLLRGSSRRMLPGLVAGLGEVDVFVHDSMHTSRNVRFELAHVWPALRPGGVALLDDVHRNAGTHEWIATTGAEDVVCEAEDRGALIAALVKPARARSRPVL